FDLVDRLYSDAMKLVPAGVTALNIQTLLICHKSFLSAASLIGQAQPEDAGAITRRAIEAVRLAAIFKTIPEKYAEWAAEEERTKRWDDRRAGKKPKKLQFSLPKVHLTIEDIIEDLSAMLGVLSDADVHFTPEFLAQLSWKRDKGSIYLGYF